MMLLLAACCGRSEVRTNPIFCSFDFVRMTHDRTAAAMYIARYYRVLL